MHIYIITFGCTNNFHESEVMAGLLSKAGILIVEEPKIADIIIINICTVKGEATALKAIRKTRDQHPDKKFIIAGCITDKLYEEVKDKETCFINTHNIKDISKVVKAILEGKTKKLLEKKEYAKLCFPKIRKNNVIAIVPISSGCNNLCAYCSVKKIKGKLYSYPKEKILEEIKAGLRDECKEIWITAQDTAAYEHGLPDLIKEINSLPGKFYIRIGMMNPNSAMKVLNNLIEVYKLDKVFKFLHLPIQAGNDEVLKSMNRKYTVQEFKEIISKFREAIPKLTISTDIICGFPEETEEQFNDSVELIRWLKPDVLNISRYQNRPGTKAETMKQIVSRVTKERSRKLTKVFKELALERNKAWTGWEGEILIDEKGKPGTNTFIGRNYCYKPVIIKGDYKLGSFADVEIKDATIHDLRA